MFLVTTLSSKDLLGPLLNFLIGREHSDQPNKLYEMKNTNTGMPYHAGLEIQSYTSINGSSHFSTRQQLPPSHDTTTSITQPPYACFPGNGF